MDPDCFLDTNILVYSALGRYSEPKKYARARDLIASTHFGISGQVLAEFYVNATRKGDIPLTPEQAHAWILALVDRPCAAVDTALVAKAILQSVRYGINYFDAAIVAAAEVLRAPVLYTEDLNHGQTYGSVRVINPFLDS